MIGKIVVQRDAIELRGGLVIFGGPGAPAVGAHVGAAVVAFDHAVGIVRSDPQVVIVAVRRVDGRVGLASIVGSIEAGVDYVHRVFLQRVGEDSRVIPGALPQLALVVDFGPGAAAVVGAKYAAILGFHDGPHAIGILGRNRDADSAENAFRHTGI